MIEIEDMSEQLVAKEIASILLIDIDQASKVAKDMKKFRKIDYSILIERAKTNERC